MSPAPSRSLALQHIKLGDALEIRDAIIFDFHPGLPHMILIQNGYTRQIGRFLSGVSSFSIFQGPTMGHFPSPTSHYSFLLIHPHTVWLHCTHGVVLSGVITLCPFIPPFHAYRCIYTYSSLHLSFPLTHDMYTCLSTHTSRYTHLPPSRLHQHHLADHMPSPVSPGPPQLAPACPPFHLGYPTQ